MTPENKKVENETDAASQSKQENVESVEKEEKVEKVKKPKKTKKAETAKPAEEVKAEADSKETETQPEPDTASESVTETDAEPAESELTVKFSVEVKKEDIDKNFTDALASYANDIKLPGFRKGKAPLEVVRNRFNEAITEEVKGKLLEEAVFKKVQEDNLRIISQPQVAEPQVTEEGNLTAEVTVEVFPEVKLPDLESLEAEIPAKDLEPEPFEEDKAVDHFLMRNQRQTPVMDREVKDADMIVLEVQSKPLDTKRMSKKNESYYVVEKEGQHDILDLYPEINGKKPADTLVITRTYPADYKKKPWAGKDVEHHISIKRVFEMVKPELDEAFLKQMGYEDEAGFRAKLKSEYDAYASKHREDKQADAVMDVLSKSVEFPIPKALVQQEMTRAMQQNQQQFNPQSEAEAMQIIQSMKENAERTVKYSFIQEAIKSEFKIDVSSGDLNAEYKKVAEAHGADIKEVKKFYMKKENQQQLENALEGRKIIELLMEKIKIKEV